MRTTEEIKLEMMKYPKGSLYEPQRTKINGITVAYIELAKKVLDRISAEILIHSLYFEFEKPVSEYLGFAMPIRIPLEYMMTK
jgi:hypothetical protein